MAKRRRFPPTPSSPTSSLGGRPPSSPRDDADEFLNREQAVRDFEKLELGEAWVVARATMLPIYLSAPKTVTTRLTDKPQTLTLQIGGPDERIAQVCQPPNGIVRYRFQIEDSDGTQVFRTYMAARAVRNYLAYVLEMPVPLRFVLLTKGMMLRQDFDIDPMRYHRLSDEMNPEGKAAFYADIESAYPRTEELLRVTDPSSPLGRAISSVGRAVWNEDDEDAFLAAWRGVDIVSKMDNRSAMTSAGPDVDSLQAPYREVERRAAAGGNPPRVSDLAKVQITFKRRLGDVPPERVAQLNELRGIIAHDVLDSARFRTIRQDKWEMIALAKRIIASALVDPALRGVPEEPSSESIAGTE